MQRRSFLRQSGTLLFYLLLFLFFAAPVLRLISMSLRIPRGWGLTNFQVLFQDSRTLEAIHNTLFISLWSAVLSTFLGTMLGFLMAYTDLRHKKALELLILLPFIIPSYIITLSWSGLFLQDGRINLFLRGLGFAGVNLYTRGGILFVLGIVNMPVVYLSVIHFLRKVPVDLDLATRSCGFSSWETWRRINLKEALPATADNFSWENFQFVFSSTGVMDALETSLLLASTAGAICLVAGTLIAYWKLRRHSLAALLAERGGGSPGLCSAWHRPGPGRNLPLGGTPARHQTGNLRDHGAPSHRLRDPVHDPPNQREHQRPPGHQSGTGRRGAGLWERLADSFGARCCCPFCCGLVWPALP